MDRRAFLALAAAPLRAFPASIRFIPGPINQVRIGRAAAVYGSRGSVAQVLLTHARRDAIGKIAERATVYVPAGSLDLFAKPEAFWSAMETGQFHDYAQQSSKVPVRAIEGLKPVRDQERIPMEGAKVRVIDTPGYSPHAVSYLIETEGQRAVCTGDLIYGDGRLHDLFSLQDAIPALKVRGYHGYAARAGTLITSLRKVAALQPDVLLPAHGPAITNPARAIAQLVERLQGFLQSHFEIDALRWYFGEESHRVRSRAVERPLNVMPMAEQGKLPTDILAFGNSRLILSATGAGFLVDAGFRGTLPELRRLREAGRLRSVEGIWITHYHDDHTDYINDVTAEFPCPVYFTSAMAEVMAHPSAFRLPCLTTRPVTTASPQADGQTLAWHEWKFTFWNFPGQTLYHGGLVAERKGQTYLFVGDSFTPSGIDDYCMQNRDFLRPGQGYDLCLTRIASLPKDTWLMNQHVEPMFRYTAAEIQRMRGELTGRTALLREFSPWPDPNFMVDESWARLFPYATKASPGQPVTLELRITNHAPTRITYRVRWSNGKSGTVNVEAFGEGKVSHTFPAPAPGLHVVTASVSFAGHDLQDWAEALVRVT
ncbi:MAG: MBL fold metallo-hydrolase [Bryobacteraceae bacterium]|nr:MBL fold metallo-hydrolase [Bryobacteraceae bacterium]